MAEPPQVDRPQIRLDGHTIRLAGSWTAATLDKAFAQIPRKIPSQGELTVDLLGVVALDTSGAWFIDRALRDLRQAGREVRLRNMTGPARSLLDLVAAQRDPREVRLARPHFTFLQRTGHATLMLGSNAIDYLEFLGQTAERWLMVIGSRRHWRLPQFFTHVEQTGVSAVPIISLLSFLIGVVIAYQGLYVLRAYGATLFVANLSGVSIFRELGPLIAAIVVAGRTGSAFTAEIGTMKVAEEVDAIVTMGLSPAEILVLPRVFGLMFALPLLTVLSDAAGMVGASLTATLVAGISPHAFLEQLAQAVSISTILAGLAKSPVFALVIASVGCFHGFRSENNAKSVGKRTTLSVVQGIFFVIVIDAAFSVVYSTLHI